MSLVIACGYVHYWKGSEHNQKKTCSTACLSVTDTYSLQHANLEMRNESWLSKDSSTNSCTVFLTTFVPLKQIGFSECQGDLQRSLMNTNIFHFLPISIFAILHLNRGSMSVIHGSTSTSPFESNLHGDVHPRKPRENGLHSEMRLNILASLSPICS